MNYINEIKQRNFDKFGTEFCPVDSSATDFAQLAYAAQSIDYEFMKTADDYSREFSQITTNMASVINEMQPFLSDCDYQLPFAEASDALYFVKKLESKYWKIPVFTKRMTANKVFNSVIEPVKVVATSQMDAISKINDFLVETIVAISDEEKRVGELESSFEKTKLQASIFLNQLISEDLGALHSCDEAKNTELDEKSRKLHSILVFGETLPDLIAVTNSKLCEIKLLINDLTKVLSDLKICFSSLFDSLILVRKSDVECKFDFVPSRSLAADITSFNRACRNKRLEVHLLSELVSVHGTMIVDHNDEAHSLSKKIDFALDELGEAIANRSSSFIEFTMKRVSIEDMLDAQREYDSAQEKY